MLTAAGAIEDRVDGLGLGADDYLRKPFVFAKKSCKPPAPTTASSTSASPASKPSFWTSARAEDHDRRFSHRRQSHAACPIRRAWTTGRKSWRRKQADRGAEDLSKGA